MQLLYWGMSHNTCVTSKRRLCGGLGTTRVSPGVETLFNPAAIFNKLLCYLSWFFSLSYPKSNSFICQIILCIHLASDKVACCCVLYTLFSLSEIFIPNCWKTNWGSPICITLTIFLNIRINQELSMAEWLKFQ